MSSPSTSTPTPAPSTGVKTWEERRKQWQTPSPSAQQKLNNKHPADISMDMLVNYEPFPKPVPLPELVEALVELWEQEEYLD